MPRAALLLAFTLSAFSAALQMAAEAAPALSVAPRPVVSIFIRSLNRLAEDAHHLSRLSGSVDSPVLLQRLDFIRMLDGIDPDERVAFVLFWNTESSGKPQVLVSVPLRNSERFRQTLNSLKRFPFESLGRDRWQMRAGEHQVFADYMDGRVQFATAPELLDFRPSVTSEVISLPDDTDLMVRFTVDGVPAVVRQQALSRFDSEIDAKRERETQSDSDDRSFRLELLKLIQSAGRLCMAETQQVELRVAIDNAISAQLRWVPRQNSELANRFAALPQSEAVVVKLAGERVPFSARAAVSLPVPLVEVIGPFLEHVREKVTLDVVSKLPAEERQSASGVFDALRATLESRRLVVDTYFLPARNGRMSFLLAAGLNRSERLADTLQTVLPYVAHSDQVQDVALHALTVPGIDIHRVRPMQLSQKEARLYGPEASYYLGTSNQGLIFAQGDSSATEQLSQMQFDDRQLPPLLGVTWTFRPWIDLALRLKPEAPTVRRLSEIFPPGNSEDQVQAHVDVRDACLELQIHAESGYLRLLAQFLPKRRSPLVPASPRSRED